MTLAAERDWLERICGKVGEAGIDMEAAAKDFAAKEKALAGLFDDDSEAGKKFQADKKALRDELKNMQLVVPRKTKILRRDKEKTIHLLAHIDGKPIDIEIEESEWDSYADRASDMKGAKLGGKSADFKSPEVQKAIERIRAKLQPIIDKSREMAKMFDTSGKRIFDDNDIEEQLWTPLVREGVIPSNLVPNTFSTTTKAMSNAAALYSDLMEREEGTEMGGSKIGKLLKNAQIAVKGVSTGASEFLRWTNLDIAEIDRSTFAKFIDFRSGNLIEGKPVDLSSLSSSIDKDALEIDGKSLTELEAEGVEITNTDLTQAKFAAQNVYSDYGEFLEAEETRLVAEIADAEGAEKAALELELSGIAYEQRNLEFADLEINDSTLAELAEDEENVSGLQFTLAQFEADGGGDSGDYNTWLADEHAEITEALKTATGAEKEQLEADLERIEMAQLTQAYGEYTRQQAMLSCATAAASGALDAAQNVRDRKKTKMDVMEGVFGSILNVTQGAVTFDSSAMDLTTDSTTQNRQHAIKFAFLGSKAGIKAINKIVAMAEAGTSPSRADIIDMLADVFEGVGHGVAASGTKGEDGFFLDTIGAGGDGRAAGIAFGLFGKAAGEALKVADRLATAAKEGNWKAFGEQLALLPVSAAFAGTAGLIGDKILRNVSDPDDVPDGATGENLSVNREVNDQGEYVISGFEGDSSYSGPLVADPFVELGLAGGQTGLGMNGAVDTANTQAGVVDDAIAFSQEMWDRRNENKEAEKKVAENLKKISKLAAETKKALEEAGQRADADLDRLIALKPDEKLDAGQMVALLQKLKLSLDKKSDADAVAALDIDKAKKKELTKKTALLKDKLALLESGKGNAATDDEVRTLYEEIAAEMSKDKIVQESLRAEVAEDDARIEMLKEQSNLKRLDGITDPKEYAREHDRAMEAIELLTAEVKKTDRAIKIADMASKGATGIVLAAVPGVGLLGKIRTLVADSVKLHRRRKELTKWTRQMNSLSGTYSAFAPAVIGEREVLQKGVAHDAVEVLADASGVLAESFRLADHTHVGAAVATTFEKITKFLNGFWFKKWGESRIKNGWELFLAAKAEPENRRLAREAIRTNTTLGKCVLAYGACVKKDGEARRVLQATGLTPEAFEDQRDVCSAVVDYLRAALQDKEVETIGAHVDVDWRPAKIEVKSLSWAMIKANACKLKPPLAKSSFKTPEINGLLKTFEKFVDDLENERLVVPDQKPAAPKPPSQNPSAQNPDGAAESESQPNPITVGASLRKRLQAYAPYDENGKLHVPMAVAAKELSYEVDAKTREIEQAMRKARMAAAAARKKAAAERVKEAAKAAPKAKEEGEKGAQKAKKPSRSKRNVRKAEDAVGNNEAEAENVEEKKKSADAKDGGNGEKQPESEKKKSAKSSPSDKQSSRRRKPTGDEVHQ